jgi:hypothetical protein
MTMTYLSIGFLGGGIIAFWALLLIAIYEL